MPELVGLIFIPIQLKNMIILVMHVFNLVAYVQQKSPHNLIMQAFLQFLTAVIS